jgi:hypothetical protein
MRVLELKVPPPIVTLVLAILMWLTPALAGLVQIPYPARMLCAVVLGQSTRLTKARYADGHEAVSVAQVMHAHVPQAGFNRHLDDLGQ